MWFLLNFEILSWGSWSGWLSWNKYFQTETFARKVDRVFGASKTFQTSTHQQNCCSSAMILRRPVSLRYLQQYQQKRATKAGHSKEFNRTLRTAPTAQEMFRILLHWKCTFPSHDIFAFRFLSFLLSLCCFPFVTRSPVNLTAPACRKIYL